MAKRWATAEKAANIALVAEIKKYPCIYNNNMSDYDRRDIVDAAWKTIAATTGGTVSSIKEKWRYLRSVFVKRRRLDRTFETKPYKLYYLTDIMQFIAPFIRVIKPKKTSRRKSSQISSSNVYDDDNKAFYNISPFGGDPPTTRSQKRNSGTVQTESALKQRNGERESNRELVADRVDYTLKKKSKQEEHRNARKHLLLSVLPDVEKFTDEQYSIFRRKLLDAIDYAGSFQGYSKCDKILSPASSNLTKSTATSFVYVCDDDSL